MILRRAAEGRDQRLR